MSGDGWSRIGAWSVFWVVAGLLVVGKPASAEDLAPRPISEAERAAVELAVLYLTEGGDRWVERLAPESPWSGLDEEAALREIEVRAGPPEGSTWTLQTPGPGLPDDLAIFSVVFPSGAEETLSLRLARQGNGTWRIREIRSLSEPAPESTEPFFLTEAAPRIDPLGTEPAPPPEHRLPGQVRGQLLAGLLVGLLVALLLGLLIPLPIHGARRRSGGLPLCTAPGGLLVALAGLVGMVSILACGGPGVSDGNGGGRPGGAMGAESGRSGGQLRLGSLRDVRWSLATDGDPAALEQQIENDAPEGLPYQIAQLWRAQLLLRQVDLREAEAILAELPEPGPVPLADLLRARLATTRGNDEDASWSYDQVRTAGPDHDGLRLEIAAALSTLGFDRLGEIEAIQLAEMGSRDAQVWYIRAQLMLLDDEPEEGLEILRTAWTQEPVPRSELFDNPLLATLIARPELFPIIEPGSPREPMVEPADWGRRAVTFPRGSRASLLGRLLRVELRESDPATLLEIPGGSEIAPADAQPTNAAEWERREREAALARLDELSEQAATLAGFGRPRLRREILEAAAALALQNRWDELVLLTDGIDGQVARAPAVLVQLRARALRQTSRNSEARKLLIRLATTAMDAKRPAPGVLYQLAELFVSDQEYDVALRLLRKAATISPLARNEARMRQIRLEKWLYENPERHWSDHFEVIYPKRTGAEYPDHLAAVLEAERKRIGRWVPLRSGYPIEVDLFPLRRFLRAYSNGMIVLGIYDGRVRVPFADLRSLHPRLISVLSHEVAHALIGQATDDQAPHWFQEGLAQHVEMLPGRVNPIPDLHEKDRVISFPLLEPILEGFAEPQLVDLAYGESAWVVHYLESVHGVRSLHEMVRAFARGLTTEEALQEVLGMSVARFDRAVWDWCLHEAPDVWPTQLVRYDEDFDSLLQRSDDPDPPDRVAGRRRSRPDPETSSRSDPRPTMPAWHASYSRTVAEFKGSLGSILSRLREVQAPQPMACVTLSAQVNRILQDDTALHPPDPNVARPLQSAFRHFSAMAEACSRKEIHEARASMLKAEKALGQAARALGPHGLRP